MWEEDIRIKYHYTVCGLQSTEVLELWWGYHTNLSIKASLPKLALRPQGFPEGHEQEAKAQRAAQRTAAAARKQAKMMKPRKENVSQLTD